VRWRLEPKSDEDAQKQKKGELIEPLKPIVYYIDPATPENGKIHQKVLMIGKSPLKQLDGKMLSVENIGQKTTRR
jgi:hypothetical protein